MTAACMEPFKYRPVSDAKYLVVVPRVCQMSGSSQEIASVLIVEDDIIIGMMIEETLHNARIETVGPAVSASHAMALASASRPTMALMDIRLVGPRSGIDLALALYREFGLRSIFVSANCDNQTMARCAAAAPLGCVQKPFAAERLLDAVKGALTTLSADRADGGETA